MFELVLSGALVTSTVFALVCISIIDKVKVILKK